MPTDPPESKRPWSRLPDETPDALAGVKRGAAGAAKALRAGATDVAATIASGFRAGANALTAPAGSDLTHALAGVDLPEIGDGVALRSLSSAVWAERVAQVVSVLGGLGALVLAVLGALSAVFGSEDMTGRAILLAAAGVTIGLGGSLVTWVAGRARDTQRDIAQSALRRSDLAEVRLHRLTVVIAQRQAGAETFAAALTRLEQDVG